MPKSKQSDELRELFNTFDTDGSGSITANELELVLAEMGVKVSSERLAAMIREVDGEVTNDLSIFRSLADADLHSQLMAAATSGNHRLSETLAEYTSIYMLSRKRSKYSKSEQI